MEITLGQQYNVGEKPTVIVYTYYIIKVCSEARAGDQTLTPLLYFPAGDQTLTP